MNASNAILTPFSQAIKTDIAAEPVSLAELKAHLNVTYADDDTLITALGKEARQLMQNACGKVFGEATIELSFTHNGQRSIRLSPGIASEILTIEYRECRLKEYASVLDEKDTVWTLENGRFEGERGAYKATYKTAFVVDEALKGSIKQMVAYLYVNREDVTALKNKGQVAAQLVYGLIPGENLL